MNRKDKIFHTLTSICEEITMDEIMDGFKGFETKYISELSGINRSNTSKELNALYDEQKVMKIKGRPVYYFDKGKLEEIAGIKINRTKNSEAISLKELITNNQEVEIKDVFHSIIGSSNTLKTPIKQAKAAVLYPPRGLHTLIIGPTGAGKTTFAETMYNFAVQSNTINSGGKFTVFNCAEYAENPQLLLSMLFGHIKGAFTGADTEKNGLVETSNGGILLLDEVHRLPPEGQEMLFMVIDKGVYRKLGDTEKYRKSNVFIIGATTEDITTSLLQTFTRRFPMVINLPFLNEWTLPERFQLISDFFEKQSKVIGTKIRLYNEVIHSLLLYDCNGNIGQLKSDIQLLCAKGFLEYKTYNKKMLEINTSMIPEHIYDGLMEYREKRKEIMNIIPIGIERYHDFFPEHSKENHLKDEYDISNTLYNDLGTKYTQYSEKGYDNEEIKIILNSYIEEYLKLLLNKYSISKDMPSTDEIFKIVSPQVYNAVKNAIRTSENKYDKNYASKLKISLMMHISALIERLSRNENYEYKSIKDIALNYHNEFQEAKLMVDVINTELNIKIPQEEVGIVTMLLHAVDTELKNCPQKVGVIVMAHGNHTATSMAAVANSLLGTKHCHAIDMPLEEKVDVALQKAIDLVKKIDQQKGALILVDMGSLIAFGEIITKKTNIKVQCIEMVSTPIVIEVVRKSLIPDTSLEQIVEEINRVHPYVGRIITNETKRRVLKQKPRTIITTCITGKGTAIKLEKLIRSGIPIINEYNIEIKAMKYNYQTIDNDNVIAVVGAINPKVPHTPFISIDDLILGDGYKRLEAIIYNSDIQEDTTYHSIDSNINLISKTLKEMLTFLDPSKAYHLANQSFEYIAQNYKITDKNRKKLLYVFHVAGMIERIMKNEAFQFDEVDEIINKNKVQYNRIKKSLKNMEDTFSIKIPDTEISYLIDLIDTE